MERSRLTARLVMLPLCLLAWSGTVSAVEVLPQPKTTGMTHQARQVAQQTTLQHLERMIGQRPASAAATVEFTAEDREKIAEANASAASGTPLKIGLMKSVALGVDLQPLDVAAMKDQTYSFQQGTVKSSGDRLAWTVRLDTVGSLATRVRFDDVSLPEGSSLYVYNDAGEVRGPYSGKARSFWSHSLPGDRLYVQVDTTGTDSDKVSFKVGAMMLIDSETEAFCPDNAPCIQDGSCYDSSDWEHIDEVRKAIAHINFVEGDGSYMCTGGLLADTDDSSTIPYFLTANHCISTPEVAATVEAWFNYQTESCGAECPSLSDNTATLGATLLDHSAVDDHSLMVLNEDPPAEAWFLGWSSTPVAYIGGTPLYRLSHPLGSPQAYSTQEIDAYVSPVLYCGTTTMPRGAFIFSRDVIGATEGGSSGSPVMQENGQVVGQLFGACGSNLNDVCDSANNVTVDGAFANYYTDVSKWLSPDEEALPLTLEKRGTGEGRVVSSLTSQSASQSTGTAQPQLLGGSEIDQSDWSWQAALKVTTWSINSSWTCGGSVIDPYWILTAAHCIVDDSTERYSTVSPSNIQIRAGSNRFEYGGQESKVKRIVKHPDFDPLTRDNDIALIELKSPVYADPIRPVTLEREETLACLGTAGAVTGWTATTACGNLATVLSKVDATIVLPSVCGTVYGALSNNMICTSSAATDTTECQSDDGSPLAVGNGRGGYAQAGIVSFGNGCDDQSAPTAYTRVANYVSWMERMTDLDLTSDVGPGIIDCGSVCRAEYAKDTLVTLTASASAGSVFAGWEGDCTGTDSSCELTMSKASNVRAIFNAPQASSQSICTP
ncbi:peptidase S1 and S6 chymotrypsin/Hap [Thiorhodococcus drewsii AZ1]|uniref:Peptidase S1 and S6 chymotrypsin/Hap n=1 Tax=Thiorhodococcus drewsii AZ1 TaxID=765913 RepID=G2DVI0_9GAMM|nr:trypsin-like serine protease [Thiorhodococcus drewsii]EGV33995.1 peptidase S1 and S6 chymotrypsin/Hap [Thiorhodococcus drewsii AZ1]